MAIENSEFFSRTKTTLRPNAFHVKLPFPYEYGLTSLYNYFVLNTILIFNLNKEVPKQMATEIEEIPIQKLEKGERGTVTALMGEPDEVARLSALGIRKGVEVCTLRKGCPCIVQFGCSRMCLRTAGHLKVMVSPIQ